MFFKEAKWCFLKQNVHICCPSYWSFHKVPHGANPIKVFFSLTHIYQKNAIKLAHCKIKFFFVCYKCSILTARIEKRVKNKIGGIGSWFSYFAFQYLGRIIWLRIKKKLDIADWLYLFKEGGSLIRLGKLSNSHIRLIHF